MSETIQYQISLIILEKIVEFSSSGGVRKVMLGRKI